jgi:hypothetical protein
VDKFFKKIEVLIRMLQEIDEDEGVTTPSQIERLSVTSFEQIFRFEVRAGHCEIPVQFSNLVGHFHQEFFIIVCDQVVKDPVN